jgi:hypothetical protein
MAIFVANDRVVHCVPTDIGDIVQPSQVLLDGIAGQSDDLGSATRYKHMGIKSMATPQEQCITLVSRLANSASRPAMYPSSVVHTGVKARGWEKMHTHWFSAQEWKSISPLVDFWVKLGAMSPIRRALAGNADMALKIIITYVCRWIQSGEWQHFNNVFSSRGGMEKTSSCVGS